MGFMDAINNWQKNASSPADEAGKRAREIAAGMSGGASQNDPMLDATLYNQIPLADKGGVVPRINLHDGKHRMIIAEEGERVLTPEQNKEYEHTHPGARQEPMHANVMDCGGMVYDKGGYVPEEAPRVAMPDQELALAPKVAPIPALTAGPRDYLDRPATLEGLDRLYNKAISSYGGGERAEYSTELDPQGRPEPIASSHMNDKNRVQWNRGDMALVHTHPKGDMPQPSPGDFAAANQMHAPNFELSRDAVWAAMPGNPKPVKVADVEYKHGKPVYKWVNTNMDKKAYDCGGMVYDKGGIIGGSNENVYDKGGAVVEPAKDDSLWGRIKDRAAEIYGDMKKYVPTVQEPMGGIAAKQQQVDEYKAAEQAERPKMQQPYSASPSDRINPGAKYGDKPGEKRPEVPLYDDGGTVQPEKNDQEKAADDAAAKDAAMRQAVQEVHMEEAPVSHGTMSDREDARALRPPVRMQYDTEKPVDESKGVADQDSTAGAKSNTQNAPLGATPMSMKNTTAMMPEVMEREASAQKPSAGTPMPVIETPRPNKMSSPGTTDHPSDEAAALEQQRRMGPEDPSRLPAISPEHRATPPSPEKQIALDDQMEAMKSGNLVKLGMSNINLRMLEGRDKDKPENVQPALPTPTAPTARENIVNQKAQLKDKMINAPTEQERFQAEKDLAELNRRTPLGSEGSSMPGIGGKILHGLSRAGQIALSASAPYALPMIPGTQANIAAQEARGEQGVEAAQKKAEAAQRIAAGPAEQKLKEAQAARTAEVPLDQQMIKEYDELDAAKASGDPARIEAANTRLDHLQSVKTAMLGDEEKRPVGDGGVVQHNKELNQMTQGMSPDQAKKFEDAFSVGPHDTHKVATKRLEDAKAVVAMNEQERDRALQRSVAERNHQDQMNLREDERQDRLRGKFYTYTDAEGTHLVQGNQLPEGAKDELAIPNAQQFLAEASSSNIVQSSLSKVYEDVEKHPEIFDNEASRAILATTLEQIDRQAAGLLVAGTGGQIPLPSGLGDMINTHLQNKALDKPLAEALKTYIADYKNMKDKAIIMQMDMQGGKIGRASQVALNAIINQIPNGSTPDSKRALQQLANMQTQQTELVKKYPEKYQDYTKEKAYTPKSAGEKGEAAPKVEAGHTVKQGDKSFVIDAVDANGKPTKWHPAP
jgi:hypothetical protein